MERIISRPSFDGQVIKGGKYALVDDVSTMGTTLAELANFIQHHGGVVVGAVLLVNASRAEKLSPTKKAVSELERRHENGIKEIFGIEPKALTADEATYLLGFRTTDAIRNRVASAREATNLRLYSKGICRPSVTSATNKPLILLLTCPRCSIWCFLRWCAQKPNFGRCSGAARASAPTCLRRAKTSNFSPFLITAKTLNFSAKIWIASTG